MEHALYDARIYMNSCLVFHTYYHSNQLPFNISGLNHEQIRKKLMEHIDKLFVNEEQYKNIAECLVTVFGCDRMDPLQLDQRHFKPYIINLNT